MKKILLIVMSMLLAACGVVQPVQQEQATPVVQTVVVTFIPPTEALPPTSIPTATLAPTEVPTNTPLPTNTVEPTVSTSLSPVATVGTSDLTPVYVDNILGKGVFADITFSSNRVTLNCYPREFEITIRAIHPDVTRAELYYRVLEAPTLFRYSDWFLLGNMNTDGNGNFFITFKATDIKPDWRALEQAFLEFQFIGINKGAGVVDRTQHIEKAVAYYKDCP